MDKISNATLQSLRDFIADALSDPNITPFEIAQAIRDELSDAIEYHRVTLAQAEKALDLLTPDDSTKDISTEFSTWLKDDVIESIQDDITFGNYNFKLNSDYLNDNKNDFKKFK